MFKSPRTLDFALANRANVRSAEQLCHRCTRWFDVTAPMRAMLANMAARRAAGARGYTIEFCTCPHCAEEQILLIPGKYDSHGARRPRAQKQVFG